MLADVLDHVASQRDPVIEESLLGALILDPTKIDVVSPRLRSTDFWDRDLGAVYAAICDLHEMKRPVGDPKVLITSLRKFGIVKADGQGVKQSDIARWVHATVPANALVYAEEIIRVAQINAQLRTVIHSVDDLARGGRDPRESANELTARLETIYSRSNVEIVTLADAARRAIEKIAAGRQKTTALGISTSLNTLDDMLGGLFPGELTILAARPSVGKTALAMQICHSAAVLDRNVLFISLEMMDEELATRVLCAQTGVNNKHIRQNTLQDVELERLRDSIPDLEAVRLNVYAANNVTLKMIRAAVRYAGFRQKVDLVCIDYLQLIEPEDKRKIRAEQVAEISKSLKNMAKEFEVPFLVLSQLNREAEGETPTMRHLRESGSIEQDADVIIAIHREKDDAGKNVAQLIVLKNRHGERGTIDCTWHPEATRFEEPEQTLMP